MKETIKSALTSPLWLAWMSGAIWALAPTIVAKGSFTSFLLCLALLWFSCKVIDCAYAIYLKNLDQ